MKKIMLFIMLSAMASLVYAESWKPYVSGAIGRTNYDYSMGVGEYLDDNATALRIAIGHQIPKVSWLAAELEYVDFGDADKTIPFYYYDINTDFEAQATNLWLVARWMPAEKWGLEGRVGYGRADADVSVSLGNTSLSVGSDDSGTAVGVGVAYYAKPNVAFTLDVRKQDLTFSAFGESFDYNPVTTMLGVRVTF